MKAPFLEWRLFLRSAIVPVVIYGGFLTFYFTNPSRVPASVDAVIGHVDTLIRTVAVNIFLWGWMSGLWHGRARPQGKRPYLWLRFTAMFTAVACLSQLVDMLPGEIFARLTPAPASAPDFDSYEHARSMRIVQGVVSGVVGLLLIWVTTRLTTWQPMVIDHGAALGPRGAWRQTKGHAWRIFWIGVVIWLPVAFILFCVGYVFRQWSMGNMLDVVITQISLLYFESASAAAALLIYRDFNPPQTDLDVF